MTLPKNEKVKNFLDDLRTLDDDKFELLAELREIVLEAYPKTAEKIMYGGIMFSLNSDDFSGLFVRKKHISLEFGNGFSMTDPNQILEGSGKFRRHLKIRSKGDISTKQVAFFVKQAIAL